MVVRRKAMETEVSISIIQNQNNLWIWFPVRPYLGIAFLASENNP